MQYLPKMGTSEINNSTNIWYAQFPEICVDAINQSIRNYSWVSTKWVRPRNSKLGDYRPAHGRRSFAVITLNANLDTYVALLVWVHEFAHHVNWERNGAKVAPHGPEWKFIFRDLYFGVFKPCFPESWQKPLNRYFKNPSAATFSHPTLHQFIAPTLHPDPKSPMLSGIPDGTVFIFKNREFRKERMLRTFVLCNEIQTGRKYRIRANCSVSLKVA